MEDFIEYDYFYNEKRAEQMALNFEKGITENLCILATFLSPHQPDLGILITAEEYFLNPSQLSIKIHLIVRSNSEWHIQKELETLVFSNYSSAKKFVNDLPEMSALDLLLILNGGQKNEIFFQ